MIAALAMVATLAACGGSEEAPPDEAVAPDAPTEKQEQSAEEQANAPADPTLNLTVPGMERI